MKYDIPDHETLYTGPTELCSGLARARTANPIYHTLFQCLEKSFFFALSSSWHHRSLELWDSKLCPNCRSPDQHRLRYRYNIRGGPVQGKCLRRDKCHAVINYVRQRGLKLSTVKAGHLFRTGYVGENPKMYG